MKQPSGGLPKIESYVFPRDSQADKVKLCNLKGPTHLILRMLFSISLSLSMKLLDTSFSSFFYGVYSIDLEHV